MELKLKLEGRLPALLPDPCCSAGSGAAKLPAVSFVPAVAAEVAAAEPAVAQALALAAALDARLLEGLQAMKMLALRVLEPVAAAAAAAAAAAYLPMEAAARTQKQQVLHMHTLSLAINAHFGHESACLSMHQSSYGWFTGRCKRKASPLQAGLGQSSPVLAASCCI